MTKSGEFFVVMLVFRGVSGDGWHLEHPYFEPITWLPQTTVTSKYLEGFSLQSCWLSTHRLRTTAAKIVNDSLYIMIHKIISPWFKSQKRM